MLYFEVFLGVFLQFLVSLRRFRTRPPPAVAVIDSSIVYEA